MTIENFNTGRIVTTKKNHIALDTAVEKVHWAKDCLYRTKK